MAALATAALPYATPAQRKVGLRVWAGAVILAAALGLVLLGGCFVIGVLMTVEHTDFSGKPSPAPLNSGEIGLIVVLFLIAFACFGGAAALLFVGTRGLIRVLQGDASAPTSRDCA